MDFVAVTISDLISEGAEVSAHCRDCGHFRTLLAETLPGRFRGVPVPALEGVFRCSRCQSTNTTAMPLYGPQKRVSRATGQGWIKPPAE
jgi:hypothetical protein